MLLKWFGFCVCLRCWLHRPYFLRLFVVRVCGDCLVVLAVLVVSVAFGCVVGTAGCVLITDWR